jgi:hypothetical protein
LYGAARWQVEADGVLDDGAAGLAPAELAPVSPTTQPLARVASATPIDHARIRTLDADSHSDTSPSFLADLYSAPPSARPTYASPKTFGCDVLVSRLLWQQRLLAALDREQ